MDSAYGNLHSIPSQESKKVYMGFGFWVCRVFDRGVAGLVFRVPLDFSGSRFRILLQTKASQGLSGFTSLLV